MPSGGGLWTSAALVGVARSNGSGVARAARLAGGRARSVARGRRGRTCRAGGRSPGRRRRDPAAPGSRPLRVHHSSGAGVVDRSPSGTTSPPCRRTGLVPVSRPNLTERGGARGRRLDSGVYPWEGGGRFRGRRGCSPGRARGGGLPPWGWTLPHGGESAPKSLRERYLYGAPNHHGVTHGAIIGSSRNESESCCPQTRLVEGFAGVVGRKPAPLAGYSGMAGEPATMRVCGRPHRALLCGLRAGLRGFGYPAASPGARRARGRPPAQAWRGFAAGACNALNDASRSSPGRQPRSCLGSRRSRPIGAGSRGSRPSPWSPAPRARPAIAGAGLELLAGLELEGVAGRRRRVGLGLELLGSRPNTHGSHQPRSGRDRTTPQAEAGPGVAGRSCNLRNMRRY